MNKVTCPNCKSEGCKVIAWAMPMRFCKECSCLWGFWSFFHLYVTSPIESFFGDTFAFFEYEGSYWEALWWWLFDKE